MIGWSLFLGIITAADYIALEPHVRRRWPQSMVTWSRLLSGQIRDPLVGSHMLIGITLLTGADLLKVASSLYSVRSGVQSMETSGMLDHLFFSLRLGIAVALGLFFLSALITGPGMACGGGSYSGGSIPSDRRPNRCEAGCFHHDGGRSVGGGF